MTWACFTFPICQCRGTVFIKIWWQVLLIAIYSTIIVTIHKKIIFPNLHVRIPWTLVPILGVATGMLLVFRTNTAYDRYWEARKLWSSMTTATRNLTRNIWVGIKEPEGDDTSKVLVEKVSALNILSAFGYATRNYLRGEYSYEDADLKQLLRHVPKFYNFECKCKNSNKRRSKGSLCDDDDGCAALWCRSCFNTKQSYKYTAYEEETPTNIPMELSYLLAAYIKNANSRNLIDPSLLAPLNNGINILAPQKIYLGSYTLNSLVDCLTGFERILRTPIPLAYSVHLHHATWIYLLTLPSQLVDALGWGTAFATSLASFCLLGVLEIGWEIENPFGKDSNDLPLDDFCRVTHREIQKIMGRKVPSTDIWLMSPANRPLAPACSKNAQELARLPPDDLRSLMKRNPAEIRKYFKNYAFVPDEPVTETTTTNVETSPSPPPSEHKSSKSSLQSEKEEKASDSASKNSKEDDEGNEEEEEEDEPSEPADISSKRVLFVLPDDKEIEVKEISADEEEEDEEEIGEEDDTSKGDKKSQESMPKKADDNDDDEEDDEKE